MARTFRITVEVQDGNTTDIALAIRDAMKKARAEQRYDEVTHRNFNGEGMYDKPVTMNGAQVGMVTYFQRPTY